MLDYLKKENFCVLVTASKTAKPEAAIVCFVVKSDFSVLLFTDPRSRKAKNLRENKKASIVIGDVDKEIEIQMDGEIRILGEGKAQEAKKFILKRHPDWLSHMDKRSVIFLHFRPIWLQYCNHAKEPCHEILELKDFQK